MLQGHVSPPLDLLEKERELIQQDPAYADLARWQPVIKEELLFDQHRMIVVEGEFLGRMPLNWITRGDFDKSGALVSRLERAGGCFLINPFGRLQFKMQIIDAVKLLMTRPTSRECMFETVERLKLNRQCLRIVESERSEFSKSPLSINLSLTDIGPDKACGSTEEGGFVPIEQFLHIALIHEIIHCKHTVSGEDLSISSFDGASLACIKFLASHNEMHYENGSYSWPQLDGRYTDWEELWTIEGLPNVAESINRFTENRVRQEFGYPRRSFHCGYEDALREGHPTMPSSIFNDDLIVAFYRNEEAHSKEILAQRDERSLINRYFDKVPSDELESPFSLQVIKSLSDQTLEHFNPSDSYIRSLLKCLEDPSFRKAKMVPLIIGLLNFFKSSLLHFNWKESDIALFKRLIDEMPLDEVLHNPLLEEYRLFLALFKEDEECVDAVLRNKADRSESIRNFMMLVPSLAKSSYFKREELAARLLKKLNQSNF